jgi:hypothetical protein
MRERSTLGRTTLLALLAAGLVAACAPRSPTQQVGPRRNCAWRVCLFSKDDTSGRTYTIHNDEPVPVTIGLEFRDVSNLRPPEEPVHRVVPPMSSVEIPLHAVRRGEPFQANVAISIDLGASSTVPNPDVVYAVPFGGSARRPIIQGFDGDETHLASMRYSLDFAMPEGTPVLAARDGVVLYVQDGFMEGRADPRLLERANLVVVAHSDGTMASYGHLRAGLAVAVGHTVLEGELLGLSGRSGFAGQPHLHFHVGVRMLGEPGRTIPIRLRDRDGEILDLSTGALIPPARRR